MLKKKKKKTSCTYIDIDDRKGNNQDQLILRSCNDNCKNALTGFIQRDMLHSSQHLCIAE